MLSFACSLHSLALYVNSMQNILKTSTIAIAAIISLMYYDPLKATTTRLSPNVLTAATPFAIPILGRINVGARMTLFFYGNQIIVWAAFPYCKEVEKCLSLLTGNSKFIVSHLIVPNYRHTLGALSFKEKYSDLKIIGPDGLKLSVPVDITIPTQLGNQVLGKQQLKDLGMDPVIYDNFEFVFLPNHKNKDLVMYDKHLKYVFQADVVITLGPAGTKLEQYCEETGCDKDYDPHWGYWGNAFLTRLIHAGNSWFKSRMNKLAGCDQGEGRRGIEVIYGMDFSKMVPCHGNIVDDGKQAMVKYYDFLASNA